MLKWLFSMWWSLLNLKFVLGGGKRERKYRSSCQGEHNDFRRRQMNNTSRHLRTPSHVDTISRTQNSEQWLGTCRASECAQLPDNRPRNHDLQKKKKKLVTIKPPICLCSLASSTFTKNPRFKRLIWIWSPITRHSMLLAEGFFDCKNVPGCGKVSLTWLDAALEHRRALRLARVSTAEKRFLSFAHLQRWASQAKIVQSPRFLALKYSEINK
jgi:hypothetical protein